MVAISMGQGCFKCGKPWSEKNVANSETDFIFLCNKCDKKFHRMIKKWLSKKEK